MMPTFLQLTIEGKPEFVPPRVNLHVFLDSIQRTRPVLLNPHCHHDLMVEFARFAGLTPDEWGMRLPEIKWLLERSPDIERACRQFRSDAL